MGGENDWKSENGITLTESQVSGPGASTAFAGASSAAAGGADWNVAGTDDWAASSGAAAAATTGGEWGAETKTSEQW